MCERGGEEQGRNYVNINIVTKKGHENILETMTTKKGHKNISLLRLTGFDWASISMSSATSLILF